MTKHNQSGIILHYLEGSVIFHLVMPPAVSQKQLKKTHNINYIPFAYIASVTIKQKKKKKKILNRIWKPDHLSQEHLW